MKAKPSRSYRRGSLIILMVLLLPWLAQLTPISAMELAADFPAGVEVVTALEATVDQPSDPSFVLRLSRLTMQEGQGIDTTSVADPLLLLIESGTLTIIDELGIEGAYPAGNQLVIQPGVLFALRNDLAEPVSLLLLTLEPATDSANATLATPVTSPSPLFLPGAGVTVVQTTIDPALFPARLFLSRVSWSSGTDSGTHTFPGPVAFVAESGSLAVTGPSGIEGQLKSGKSVVFPVGKPNRQRNLEADPATLLVAGLSPVGVALFQPVEGGAVAVAGSAGTPVGSEPATAASSLPMFRGNAARTGEAPGPGPESGREIVALAIFATNGDVGSSPVVDQGVVYFGSADKIFYAIDATTAEEMWRFKTAGEIRSSAVVAGGIVYFGSVDKNLYALDATTGEERWRVITDNPIYSSPAVVDGVIYFGSFDKNLYALDAITGDELWRFGAENSIYSSPAIANGVVYFGGDDKNLYAVSAATGEEFWRFSAGDQVSSSPAVVDGVVYVGSADKNLYAVDADSGEELWRFETTGRISSSPAVVDKVIYVGSKDKNLYAVDAATGEELWRFKTADEVFSSPVVANGVVYAGSVDNNLYALDAKTGEERWRIAADGDIYSSPAVVGGRVYVGSSDNILYIIGAEVPTLKSGAKATVTVETALRGAPAATGVVRATLAVGTVLTLTGDATVKGDNTWWPVTVAETGSSGWVNQNDIAPS